MLDDAFKLAIDRLYDDYDNTGRVVYHVEGYSDLDNMWGKIGKLAPNSTFKPSEGM
jgi:hypothetical protein